MDETTIASVGKDLRCELQQKRLYVAYDSVPVARSKELVCAVEFARSFIVNTTVYLGFIEARREG